MHVRPLLVPEGAGGGGGGRHKSGWGQSAHKGIRASRVLAQNAKESGKSNQAFMKADVSSRRIGRILFASLFA